MSYLNSVTLVGFVGADPEQRQAKGNGLKFSVFSLATQRSWKNVDDEWSSKTEWHRVVVFRRLLAERVVATIKKGAHVLVEGSLVSSTYEQSNGKGKKSKTTKITSWSIRALQKAGQSPAEFLSLHVRGQWGDVSEEDRQENEYSLKHGFRLLSSYRTNANETIWVVTESDRSVTTLLLPSEY
jgi:single stranded DNA-binding protein